MTFTVFSLFPEMIAQALHHGVVGQAVLRGPLALVLINPRAFARGAHQAVDDRPFGGGDGMVLSAETASAAVESAGLSPSTRIIYPSARGRRFDDATARAWSQEGDLAFFCGRYGGLDQRAVSALRMEEVSLGDFVVSGGELPALAMIDAVSRFIPGVLGNAESPGAESFAGGLLEEPQFTRPREWRGLPVPAALLTGDHARIAAWRAEVSLLATADSRPDLLATWCSRPHADSPRKRIADALSRLGQMTEAERGACGLLREPALLADELNAALVRLSAPAIAPPRGGA